MIDGNISMEEDTELRDLVVQTLENNGVLAKVRAELRASVFLTLEEQESVLNPEPLLNKSVKKYLATSKGKLLFSLVREFLEYFGLDYTISVYDPETYFGKEYNYEGRKKLCEELGINSEEPLLGEILKNITNSALNYTKKNDTSNNKLDKTHENSENFANATFDVSVPKILHDSISNSNDTSEKLNSSSSSSNLIPINVTITDKKQSDNSFKNEMTASEEQKSVPSTIILNKENSSSFKEQNFFINNSMEKISLKDEIEKERNFNINQNKLTTHSEIHQNQELTENKKCKTEFQMNNVKNVKTEPINRVGSTVYFDEIIVDGKKEKVTLPQENEFLLGELPPLQSTNSSMFGDLPPLNGKKTNINDLKELIDLAKGVSQYEEDLPSSASGSANELSPSKQKNISYNSSKAKTEELLKSLQREIENEEIIEELQSSNS